MEIKAELKKPYTEEERTSFIVEYNHNQGYVIEETEDALIAVYNEPLPPTKEEQQQARQQAYQAEVDPITCHIQRLGDEEQTAEVIAEISELVAERKAKVEEIKARYPYPEVEEETTEAEPVVEDLSESNNNEVIELYSMEI